ncbi:MAG TPA: hypothetical protein VGC01_07760 [Mucilaginibacter sp.]
MDDIYLYLTGGAVIAIFIIILNHKKQKSKVATFLKDAQDTQPVFMQAAVDKKLKTLKVALYGNATGIKPQTAALEGGKLSAVEAKKQFFINQLNELEKSYAAGGLTLKAYDDQLHQLLMQISG